MHSSDDLTRSVVPIGSSNNVCTQEEGDEVPSENSNAITETFISLISTISRLAMPSKRWRIATEEFKLLLATAGDVIGIATLADALNPELMRLARRMGIDDSLRSIALHEAMLGVPSLQTHIVERLQKKLNGLNDKEYTVLQSRLVQVPRATLEAVGRKIGVTRERARQIQHRLELTIDAACGSEIHVVAATLQERLDPLIPADELNRQIDRIAPNTSEPASTLFRRALVQAMSLTLKGELYATERAEQVICDVSRQARQLADDVGLVQERDLLSHLPDEKWLLFWPWIRRLSGLHSFYGSLAFRDSLRARVKAALISLGHPATRDEISEVCGEKRKRVGATLSNIPSIVKADRDRWGLYHWVDDVYDGIVGEIIQRIEEDGGNTTIERLLNEIPTKFNVNPQSVRVYMNSARFEIRNGWISMANPATIRLRDLDDVIDGRDQGRAPYWTFEVEERYFRGYSVLCVPPEFAKALGCAPDSVVNVAIQNLPECRALTLNWRLASVTGASFGYVSKPLRVLGLQPGDKARVTISSSQTVTLGRHEGNDTGPPSREADETLARILTRRRAI